MGRRISVDKESHVNPSEALNCYHSVEILRWYYLSLPNLSSWFDQMLCAVAFEITERSLMVILFCQKQRPSNRKISLRCPSTAILQSTRPEHYRHGLKHAVDWDSRISPAPPIRSFAKFMPFFSRPMYQFTSLVPNRLPPTSSVCWSRSEVGEQRFLQFSSTAIPAPSSSSIWTNIIGDTWEYGYPHSWTSVLSDSIQSIRFGRMIPSPCPVSSTRSAFILPEPSPILVRPTFSVSIRPRKSQLIPFSSVPSSLKTSSTLHPPLHWTVDPASMIHWKTHLLPGVSRTHFSCCPVHFRPLLHLRSTPFAFVFICGSYKLFYLIRNAVVLTDSACVNGLRRARFLGVRMKIFSYFVGCATSLTCSDNLLQQQRCLSPLDGITEE